MKHSKEKNDWNDCRGVDSYFASQRHQNIEKKKKHSKKKNIMT